MASGARQPQRRTDWAAAGALLVAVLFLFAPALRHPDYLLYPTFSPHSDLAVIHWPKAHLLAQTWQANHALPLWTPANLSGMPLAANQLAMCFYPPAWLFLFLPINPVFNLLFVLHLYWGGLGIYRLLRTGFELDSIPALSGGLTFALGGKLLAHAAGGHVSLVGATAWMPWALLGLHQLLRQGRWHWAGLAAVALAMQIATHTLITLYTAYFLLAYLVWQFGALRSPWPGVYRYRAAGRGHTVPARGRQDRQPPNPPSPIYNFKSLFLPLLSIPVLTALLGAAQLLPLAELAGYSNRALTLEQAGEFALTPLTLLVGLFLPDAQGGHEMVAYLGLVPLILGFIGLSRADRRTWFLGGVVLLAALFALGRATPLFELAYRWLPGFRWVRTPARVFLPASMAVAVLAGLGMQRLTGEYIRWSARAALAVGMFSLALGLGLVILFGQVNRAALGLAFFPALTLLIVGLRARRGLSPRLALPGLVVLLFADLASFDVSMMRFVSPADAFAEGEAVADYLADQPGLFRTYSPSYSLPPHVAARAELQTADGVEPVHLAAYDGFMALAGGYDDPSFSVTIPPFPSDGSLAETFRDTQPDLSLLGLLNVEYLVAAFPMDWPGLTPTAELDGARVYRNEQALPRVWVVYPVTDVRGGGPQSWVALAEQSARAVGAGEYTARVTHYEPDRIEVEARSPGMGMLVLSEIWYPGWWAVVDGQAQPVEQVAGILRGVRLTPGTHYIVVRYNPSSVRWGVRTSLLGWVGAGLGAIVTWWRRHAV